MAKAFVKRDVVKSSDAYDGDFNPCQPCSFGGKTVSSERFCMDCQVFLCTNCTTHHTALAATRNHKLVTVDQAKKYVKDKCSVKCTVHRDKTVKYFCITHSSFGCSVCVTMKHKQCDDVEYIPEVADKIKDNNAFKTFDEKLKAIEAACKAGMAEIRKNLKVTQKDDDQLKQALKQFRKQVVGALDTMENELTSKAAKIKFEEEKKLNDLSKKMSKHQADVDAMINQVDTLLTSGKNCDTYFMVKKETDKLVTLDKQLAGILAGQTILRYQFQPNFASLDANTFGKLNCTQESLGGAAGSVPRQLQPLSGPEMVKLLKPGISVRRGKDWKWGNQDDGGLGTVVGECPNPGWYSVKWDNGLQRRYRMGAQNAYDLQIA